MRDTDGSEFTVIDLLRTSSRSIRYRSSAIIDAGGGRNVGYMELASFIGTADSEDERRVRPVRCSAGVNDVIIDLRYNGGGLVSTANLLG